MTSADDVRRQKKPLIRYSLPLLKANKALRKFLYQNLYYHPRVASANQRACQLLKSVFEAYLRQPDLLGETTSQRLEEDGLQRTVCDYLSGMTDRYLMEEHDRIFSPEAIAARGRGGIGKSSAADESRGWRVERGWAGNDSPASAQRLLPVSSRRSTAAHHLRREMPHQQAEPLAHAQFLKDILSAKGIA